MLARLVDRTGIVNDEIGSVPLLFRRPLALFSRSPLLGGPAAGLFDALLANFRRCVHKYNSIANSRPARLQHHSRVQKYTAIPRLLRSGDPPLNFLPNGWMRDGFQIFTGLLMFGIVPPDQPAQFRTQNFSVRIQNLFAKTPR